MSWHTAHSAKTLLRSLTSVLSQKREENRETWTECNQSMLISNLREAVAIKKIPLLAFYALGRSVAGVVAARWNRQTKQLFAISSPLNLQSRCQLRTQPTQEGRCSLFIPLKTCAWACEYVYTCVFIVTQRAVRGLCRFQASLGQHKHREASETGTQSVK